MIVKLYRDNTSERELKRLCDILQDGGVVIYPTDSVYAMGCSVSSVKGIDRLRQLSSKDSRSMSLIFSTISSVAEYCKVDNATFKILKRNTPGAITFILKSLSRLPDKVVAKRKTIGVRLPDNPIVRSLVEMMGEPLLSTSLKSESDEMEYLTDAELIHDVWGDRVACVIDGGYGSVEPTTIVDLSEGEVDIVRQGEVELNL
ncbi:MAG: L-threonylcarbamoyladenylate synthase [Rikenellaceae bacterium]